MDVNIIGITDEAMERLQALRELLIISGVPADISIGSVCSALVCQVELEGID